MFRIREVRVDPPLILAPMSGITDSPFRQTIKELGGCGLVVTEFMSSEALTRGYKKSYLRMGFAPEERPLAMQIFGGDPGRLADAARQTEEAGADVVDINLGCPVKKVVRSGAGAHLLRDLAKLGGILKRIRAVLNVPLTIKIRSGWDDSSINACDVARCAEDCGVDAITIHGRTKTGGFSGQADWEIVAEVKKVVNIPVIGNGDLRCPSDAAKAFRDTGCDGVMFGRGMLTNPWLMRQSYDEIQGRPTCSPTARERWEIFVRYVELARSSMDERTMLDRLKKFSSYFSHEMPGSARLRNEIQHSTSLAAVLERVDLYFHSLTGD